MSRPLSGSASARTPSSSSSRSMTASEPSTRLHKASEVKSKTPLTHPSRGLLPTAEHSKKNWRHLEGNKSVLHSPNWALFFSPYFFSQPALCFLRCTRLHWEIKSAGYLFYCTCIFFTFSALLRLNLKACRNSFFYPTSAAVFTAPTFKNDATFSPSVSPLALRTPASVQKLRRAAWRCVTSPPPPANPAMAVISPRQHPPPSPRLLCCIFHSVDGWCHRFSCRSVWTTDSETDLSKWMN